MSRESEGDDEGDGESAREMRRGVVEMVVCWR
jgi:hypothetical protein